MLDTNKYLFFHGGPGFNPLAEKALLSKFFDGNQICFWREPHSSNPDYQSQEAFSQLLKSVEAFSLGHSEKQKVILIAHSFGANSANFFAHKYPERVEKMVLLAPGFDLIGTDNAIFRKAISCFKASGQVDKAMTLESLLESRLASSSSEIRKEAIELSLQSQELFTHYWKNKEVMNQYFTYFLGDDGGMDMNALISVKESIGNVAPVYDKCNVPVTAIFGKYDFIIDKELETKNLESRFHDVKVIEFNNSAHFPHLEQQDQFLEILFS